MKGNLQARESKLRHSALFFRKILEDKGSPAKACAALDTALCFFGLRRSVMQAVSRSGPFRAEKEKAEKAAPI